MICPNCGQQARNGRTVCALCGTPLKKKTRIWPVILAILLALAILGGAAWWFWPQLSAALSGDAGEPAPAPETATETPAASPTPTPEPEPTPAPEELYWTGVREVRAHRNCALAICRDGSVRMAGSLTPALAVDVSDWTDIRDLLLTDSAVYGITGEGRVRMTGDVAGMEPAADWTGIDRLYFSAGSLFGLTPGGQLYGAGPRLYFDASQYRNVRAVLPSYADTMLVLDDGLVRVIPVLGFFSNEPVLYDVAQLALNSDYALFRMEDGSVVPSYNYRYSMEYYGWPNPFADWSGVTELVLGNACALGLTADGRVLSAPCIPSEPAPDTSDWTGVKELVFVAEANLAYGLTADGRVLSACTWSRDGFASDGWTDVTALQANLYYTVGLTAEGRVLVDAREGAPAAFDTANWRGVAAIALGDGFLLGLRSDGGVYLTGQLG